LPILIASIVFVASECGLDLSLKVKTNKEQKKSFSFSVSIIHINEKNGLLLKV